MKIFYFKKDSYNQEYGKKDALYINNFGYYEGTSEDISVSRPDGRLDYQLIYVSNGEMRIGKQTLKNGEYCIFPPNTPQVYTYMRHENSLYYWVHFTGHKVQEILQHNALTPGVHAGNRRNNETDALFLSLTRAVVHTSDVNTEYSVSLLRSIFLLLSAPAQTSPFFRAKNSLEDISKSTSIKDLATLYNMSVEHFIRSFRSSYGTTPANYRIQYQLSQAKRLLSDTELSVVSVAEMCGFSDSYYFSRVFKKYVGVTPSGFRKQFLYDVLYSKKDLS